uniref:Uncharacterized protein n=1 Tax=Monilinia fructicola TaxID=38448 RepID=A0A889XPS4_MONFR|nr:hypothetical protein KQ509_mgp12 [Monilinia fructicola]QRF72262.1 hypothetical protein [Monilinia fructicola]
MAVVLFIINILISVFFYLDLHMMCNVFLGEYLNMMSINDMLNPESSSDNNLGGNNAGSDGNKPGSEGNNSGGNGDDSGNNVPEGSEDIRNSVESKFRIQYDYNKNVPINKRPDVYSHVGAGRLNQKEVDYIHKYVHFNPFWHYSISKNKLLRRKGVKAATGVIRVTQHDINYMSRFPKN